MKAMTGIEQATRIEQYFCPISIIYFRMWWSAL